MGLQLPWNTTLVTRIIVQKIGTCNYFVKVKGQTWKRHIDQWEMTYDTLVCYLLLFQTTRCQYHWHGMRILPITTLNIYKSMDVAINL